MSAIITETYNNRHGVILSGWLEKKSKVTGFWLKRFYVLYESETEFCVLRSYHSAINTAWGVVPLKLKDEISLSNINFISTNSSRNAEASEFSICVNILTNEKKIAVKPCSNSALPSPKKSFLSLTSENLRSRSDSNAGIKSNIQSERSVAEGSDYQFDSTSKTICLRAPDSQSRLLWVKIIEAVSQHCLDDD